MNHNEILANVVAFYRNPAGGWELRGPNGTMWATSIDVAIEKLQAILAADEHDWGPLPPEPPPGKKRITASVPVTYDVSPQQMTAYLKARGWVRKGIELPEIEYWYNAEGVECAVPVDIRFRDWHQRAGEFMNTLAAVERRPTGEVLRDIAAMEEA